MSNFVPEVFPPRDWDKEYRSGVNKKAVGYTSKPTPVTEDGDLIKFPKELIFGVEQVAAINSNYQHTFLIGEAGSGKTIVLLAVLYKYTGKHVKKKNLKKVHLLIPSSKQELRTNVESFIERNCQKEWTNLNNYTVLTGYPFCSDNIYLIDEFEGEADFVLPSYAKMWISHTTVDSAEPQFIRGCRIKCFQKRTTLRYYEQTITKYTIKRCQQQLIDHQTLCHKRKSR